MTERRALVVVSPYRTEYGPQQVLVHVCQGISLAGFEPVCIAPEAARVTDEVRAVAGAVHEVESLRTVPRTFDPKRLAAFLDGHRTASAGIERVASAVDAVAIHTVSEAVFAGSLAGRRLAIPTLVHAIGMSMQSPGWAAHAYIRLLDRLSDHLLASSSAVADLLAHHGVDDARMTVVHNGIAVEQVEAATPVTLGHSGPRVGMIAAFDPRKGHELFVDAAALVIPRFPEARFFIIGGVLDEHPESLSFARSIERRIDRLGLSSSVELVGQVSRSDVLGWIKTMDVVVAPSRTEAFAHALLEAMAASKPVVATTVEGNLDAFVHGHSGIYVDPIPAQLATAVCELLGDRALATRIGVAANERVRLLFDLGVIVPALAEVVRRLVAAGPGKHALGGPETSGTTSPRAH